MPQRRMFVSLLNQRGGSSTENVDLNDISQSSITKRDFLLQKNRERLKQNRKFSSIYEENEEEDDDDTREMYVKVTIVSRQTEDFQFGEEKKFIFPIHSNCYFGGIGGPSPVNEASFRGIQFDCEFLPEYFVSFSYDSEHGILISSSDERKILVEDGGSRPNKEFKDRGTVIYSGDIVTLFGKPSGTVRFSIFYGTFKMENAFTTTSPPFRQQLLVSNAKKKDPRSLVSEIGKRTEVLDEKIDRLIALELESIKPSSSSSSSSSISWIMFLLPGFIIFLMFLAFGEQNNCLAVY